MKHLLLLISICCNAIFALGQQMQPNLTKSPEFAIDNAPSNTGEVIAVNDKYVVYHVQAKNEHTFITFNVKTLQEVGRWNAPEFEGYDFEKSKLNLKLVLDNDKLIFEYMAFAPNNSIWQQFIFCTDFVGNLISSPASAFSYQENPDSVYNFHLQTLAKNRFLMVQQVKNKKEHLTRLSAWLLDGNLKTDRYYSFSVPASMDMNYLGSWVSEDDLDKIHFASFCGSQLQRDGGQHHLRISTIGNDGGFKNTTYLPLHNKAYPVGGTVQISGKDVWIFGYYNQPLIEQNYVGSICFKVSTDINLIRLAHQKPLDSAFRAEFWNAEANSSGTNVRKLVNFTHSIDLKKRITFAVDCINYKDLKVPFDISTAKMKVTETLLVHKLDSNGEPISASVLPAMQRQLETIVPHFAIGSTVDTVIVVQIGRDFQYKGNTPKNIYAGRMNMESEKDMMLVNVPTKKGKFYSRLFPIQLPEYGKSVTQSTPIQFANEVYMVVRKGKPKSCEEKAVIFKITI